MSLEQHSMTDAGVAPDQGFNGGGNGGGGEDAGRSTVPSKPTASMLASGARAGGVSVETAWKVYQAMLKHAH
jgi:hypothetical protein